MIGKDIVALFILTTSFGEKAGSVLIAQFGIPAKGPGADNRFVVDPHVASSQIGW